MNDNYPMRKTETNTFHNVAYGREFDFNERFPISPQTVNPNIPSMNTLSQLKSVKLLSSKLDYFIEPEDELSTPSRIITMFSSLEGGIHSHDEATNVFQRYSSNEIAFIGIWGSLDSDKSYFYDRILDLCDVKDSKYTEAAMKPDSGALISFFERPFVKGNIRIFLLDCRGFQNPFDLTKTEKLQLDILMSLCEIIVLAEKTPQTEFNVKPLDIVEMGYEHFNDSFKRLYLEKGIKDLEVDEISWPVSLMVLFDSSQSIKAHQNSNSYEEELERMFEDYNFSVLHNKNQKNQRAIRSYTTINNDVDELYSKNTSTIFKEIYSKFHKKSYQGMLFTGSTLPHITTQISYELNKHKSLSFPKTFEKSKRSVYGSIYNRHALGYLIKLKNYIGEEKGYSTDYLLNSFKDCKQQTFQEYDENHLEVSVGNKSQQLYENYESKLEAYIEEKEKNIMSVNYKKSLKQLSAIRVPLISSQHFDGEEEFTKLKVYQREIKKGCDLNADTHTVAAVIKSLYRAEIIIEDEEEDMREEIEEKREEVQTRKVFLSSVFQTKMQKESQLKQNYETKVKELEKKKKIYDEQVLETKTRIKNLTTIKRSSEEQLNKKRNELDFNKKNLEEEWTSLKQRLMFKERTLAEEKLHQENKSEKQNGLQKRLRETSEKIKSIEMAMKEMKVKKGIRLAEIRRIDPKKAVIRKSTARF